MFNYIYKIIILLILLIRISFAKELLIDKIIAIVDNEIILKSDIDLNIKIIKSGKYFNDNLSNTKLQKIILNQLISNKLINKMFINENIIINDKEVNDYINNIAKNILLDKNQFIEYLSSNNLNKKYYYNFIKEKLFIKKIIKKKINPLLKISKKEFEKVKVNINNNKLFNKSFLYYDIKIIKINNNKFIKNININKFKNILINLLKNNNKLIFNNIKISKNTIIDKIYIKKINNILYKDLPMLISLNLSNLNLNKNEIIGPIFIHDLVYFIKIDSIKEIDKNKIIKEVDIDKIILNKINTNECRNINLNLIKKIINLIKENKSIDEKLFNNIKIKSLNWKYINEYNCCLKKIINKLKINELSEPFEYKNKWNIIYLKNYRDTLYNIYIKDLYINKYLLKNKSLYFLENLINDYKKQVYIKILDKSYDININ